MTLLITQKEAKFLNSYGIHTDLLSEREIRDYKLGYKMQGLSVNKRLKQYHKLVLKSTEKIIDILINYRKHNMTNSVVNRLYNDIISI